MAVKVLAEMVDYSELLARLKKERAQLLAKLDQLQARGSSGARREGSPFGKREEEADQALELEKRLNQEQRLRKSLAEIDHVMEKCQAGTYGICDMCGQPIEAARLEVLPQTSLCLKCKAHQSQDAKGAR